MFSQRFLFISTVLALTLSASAPCMAMTDAEKAINVLTQNNIPVDDDSFIHEINLGHLESVKMFLYTGRYAGTQNSKGSTALYMAVKSAHKDIFSLLLAQLPQNAQAATIINSKNEDGDSPLMKAVEQNDEAMVDTLLSYGADLSITDKAQMTPLILAVSKSNESMVKKLLAADSKAEHPYATIPLEDGRGDTALSHAIMQKSAPLATLLLGAHADAQKADAIGITPLMLAAKVGDESIARLLMDAGASLDATNKSGHTALSIAIENGHGSLARMMIERAGNHVSLNYTSSLQATLAATPVDTAFFAYLLKQVKETETLPTSLLFSALDQKNKEIAMLLLERKPDVNALNENQETLVNHAIDAGFEDIVLELMARGADATKSDSPGLTTLVRAARHNMAKVVSVLIAKGSLPDQKTPDGHSVAEMCVYSGFPETLQVLLDKGAPLEKDLALLSAIRDGKGKTVPILLDHGAAPNIMNQDGVPVITLAAEAGQSEAINAFIAHKSPLDYPSRDQQITALTIAAHMGHLDVVKALVEAGANLEATDIFGRTPLAHAAMLSKVDVVEYLLSKGANANAIDGQKQSVRDIAATASPSPERERVIQMLVNPHPQR